MNVVNYLILIPILIFYGAFITKSILLRKQGIDVNRLAKGDKPTRTRLLEAGGIIITYGMVILQCLSVLGVFPVLDIGLYNVIIGVLIALIGSLFFIMALVAMRDSWRAGIDAQQKTTLRTGGILRVSRNPAFIGFDLFYIGVAVAMPNVPLFILVALALFFFHLQILEEEKFLADTFKDDYLRYQERVRRYI